MTDDMKQACLPPAEQDEWIREAAGRDVSLKEAVGDVMRRSGGRCNPQYVHDEIKRLRTPPRGASLDWCCIGAMTSHDRPVQHSQNCYTRPKP